MLCYFQNRPLYVLGYRVTGLFSFQRNQRAAVVLKQIQKTVRFPGETLFSMWTVENYRFRRKFRRLRWSKVLIRFPASR